MNGEKVQEVRQVSVCTTWPQGLWSIFLMRRRRPRGDESPRQGENPLGLRVDHREVSGDLEWARSRPALLEHARS